MSNRRGILYVTGAFVLVGPPVLWIAFNIPPTPHREVSAPVELASHSATVRTSDYQALAQRDPMALVRLGQQDYVRDVHEYSCTLIKQERLGSKLSEVQEIEFRFRVNPRAVYMIWKTNADATKRALYMDQSDFVDKQGRKLARVEPAGAVARLFVKDIFMPIHGPEARKVSRRAIDEAGFGAIFELLEKYNGVAAEHGVLDFAYSGTGTVDGRPTFIFTRNLPYEGPSGPYPDARMVMHFDQQWLLPVAVYSYADHDETELLGSYVFTQIDLHPNFDEDAFKF
jgi:hypothetical protein